jgi:hypothetical protein
MIAFLNFAKQLPLPLGVLLFASLSACNVMGPEGTGSIKTETRQVANFEKLDFSTGGLVEIKQGASYSLTIEAQENMLPLIETEVEGKVLQIKPSKILSSHEPFKFVLTMPKLEGISIAGSGEVVVNDIFSPEEIEIEIAGSGKVTANLIAKKLSTFIAGSGEVLLEGLADEHKIDIAGSGTLNAKKLNAKSVTIDIAGSGTANVMVLELLEADIAGSGTVNYLGTPGEVKTDISGSGSINKR